MYSFGQRPDTTVIDEPFYACYLNTTNKEHPGRKAILKSQSSDARRVLDMALTAQSDVLYLKNMAHHMKILPSGLLDAFKHIILIRDPAKLITSFAKVILHPQMEDIGVQDQYAMWLRFRELGIDCPVIDSGELLKDPATVLSKLCEMLSISFDSAMLSWPAGAHPADGVWAKHWYSSVHRSTGFKKGNTAHDALSPEHENLYLAAMPIYNELFQHAIKA